MENKVRLEAKRNIQKLLKSNNEFKKKYTNAVVPSSSKERTSEYSEHFKEWPLTNTAPSLHLNHSGSPIPLFYGNESDANNKSTYDDSYIENNNNNRLPPPAGIPYLRTGESPIFYAWPPKVYQDSVRQEHVTESSGQGANDVSNTEYNSLYTWPAAEGRPMTPKKHNSSIIFGELNDKTNPAVWATEYEGKFMSPGNQQREPTTTQLIDQIKKMNAVLTTIKEKDINGYSPNVAPLNTYAATSTAAMKATQEADDEELGPYDMGDENDSPVAGLKSAPREPVPRFYAWPINYLDSTKQHFHDIEKPFESEYDSNFAAQPSYAAENPLMLDTKTIMRKNSEDHVSQLTNHHVAPSTWVTEYDAAFRRNRRKKLQSQDTVAKTSEIADISAVLPSYSDDDELNEPPAQGSGQGIHGVIPNTSFESILPVVDYNPVKDVKEESCSLATEYSDHFKPVSSEQRIDATKLIAAGKSSEKKNLEATRLGRSSSANRQRPTDTIGQAAAIRAEIALNEGELSEQPNALRTLKKRGPATYERPRAKPSVPPADTFNSSTRDEFDGFDMNLSETQNQFRWPQSNKENNSSYSNRLESSTSTFLDDSLNRPKKSAPSAGTLVIGVRKVPRPTVKNAQDLAKTTPVKKPYRHLEYNDSNAALRILTPTSQEGGVHTSKRPSTTYHQRRSSFSTTGLFGRINPDKVKLHSQDDMSKYDPILMNKRYPQESERQIGRWTTESRSSFGRSKKGSPGAML